MNGRLFLVLISIAQKCEALRITKKQLHKQLQVTKANNRHNGSAYSLREITPSPRATNSTYPVKNFSAHSFMSQITNESKVVGKKRDYGLKFTANQWICVRFFALAFLILFLVFCGMHLIVRLCSRSDTNRSSRVWFDVAKEAEIRQFISSCDMTSSVLTNDPDGEASIWTSHVLKSGILWKLNSALEPTDSANMKELHNWRRRRFVIYSSKQRLKLSYLSEKIGGLDLACILPRTCMVSELAPVQLNPLDYDVRMQAQESMHGYDLAFDRPMYQTDEEYSAVLPKTLFPILIMGESAESAALSIVVGTVSADARKDWIEIMREAVSDLTD